MTVAMIIMMVILMIMITKNDQITYMFCVRSSLILVKLWNGVETPPPTPHTMENVHSYFFGIDEIPNSVNPKPNPNNKPHFTEIYRDCFHFAIESILNTRSRKMAHCQFCGTGGDFSCKGSTSGGGSS